MDASKLAQDIYNILQSKKVRTTPYHPQTDGLTENFNKTLSAMLQAFVNKHRDDWDEYLNYVLFAYRTAIHHSTHYTPFFLLYGRQARMPSDLDQIKDKYGDYSNLDSYAIDILQKFNAHHKRAHNNSTRAKIKQKITINLALILKYVLATEYGLLTIQSLENWPTKIMDLISLLKYVETQCAYQI